MRSNMYELMLHACVCWPPTKKATMRNYYICFRVDRFACWPMVGMQSTNCYPNQFDRANTNTVERWQRQLDRTPFRFAEQEIYLNKPFRAKFDGLWWLMGDIAIKISIAFIHWQRSHSRVCYVVCNKSEIKKSDSKLFFCFCFYQTKSFEILTKWQRSDQCIIPFRAKSVLSQLISDILLFFFVSYRVDIEPIHINVIGMWIIRKQHNIHVLLPSSSPSLLYSLLIIVTMLCLCSWIHVCSDVSSHTAILAWSLARELVQTVKA